LDNPGVITIPLETPGTEELYSEAAYQFLSNAVHYWGSRGLDLGGYNVREMAADIDDVRRALGYDIITLLGGSFGSHHSLTYMRDFGQHVHRAFLWSIEGPNHTVKLPSNIQVHLERLADMFAEHFPLQPNLLELLAEVMERLENKPVRCETLHPSTLEPRVVSLGKYDLQLTLANGLGSTPFLEQLPSRIHQLVKGEYSWLAEQVIRERTHPDINLMFAVTDYASGATQARKEQILAEAPQAMLGNAINDPFHQFSDLFGAYDLGDQFRENYHSEVETLLVSGSLDARTPISNAEEVVSSLPNGSRVVIEGTSHDLSWRGDHVAELGALRNSFLEHGSVSSHKIKSGFKFEALV
jgi:pimeloyl-ACP methyl ester carboxylesterase